eukprot:147704_1
MEAMKEYMKAIQEGKPPPPIGNIPRLRSLATYDVIQAQKKVSPTQLSPRYRAALLDYASKATGGRVGSVVMEMGGGTSKFPNVPTQWNASANVNPSATTHSSPNNEEDGYFFANINSP